MKRDDPVRLKLRAEREKAQAWLNILLKGFGGVLVDSGGYRQEPGWILDVIRRINTDLVAAVEAVAKAEKAYEPYWAPRRRTCHAPKKKTKKPAVVRLRNP